MSSIYNTDIKITRLKCPPLCKDVEECRYIGTQLVRGWPVQLGYVPEIGWQQVGTLVEGGRGRWCDSYIPKRGNLRQPVQGPVNFFHFLGG